MFGNDVVSGSSTLAFNGRINLRSRQKSHLSRHFPAGPMRSPESGHICFHDLNSAIHSSFTLCDIPRGSTRNSTSAGKPLAIRGTPVTCIHPKTRRQACRIVDFSSTAVTHCRHRPQRCSIISPHGPRLLSQCWHAFAHPVA